MTNKTDAQIAHEWARNYLADTPPDSNSERLRELIDQAKAAARHILSENPAPLEDVAAPKLP